MDPLSDIDVVEIQVLDTTPPGIHLLALNIQVEAEDPLGVPKSNLDIASLLNDSIAVDTVDGAFSLDNDAPPVFPLGATLVTFTAIDKAGNVSTATATVRVLTPRTLTVRAIVDLALVKAAISAPGTDKPQGLVEDLDKFIAGIIDSLDIEQWATNGSGDTDQFRLDSGAGDGVFDNPADVVQGIFKAIADGQIQDEALINDLLTVVDNLVAADRLLAQIAITDARADPNADPQEIAEALADLDYGDRLIDQARSTPGLIERSALIADAIEKYFEGAWDAAIDSVNSQASSDADSAASQAASDAQSAISQAASDAESADSQAGNDDESASAISQAASNAASTTSQAPSNATSATSQAASDTASSAGTQAASDAASATSQAASDAASATSQAASDAASLTSQEASDAASAASQAASDAASAASQAASDAGE